MRRSDYLLKLMLLVPLLCGIGCQQFTKDDVSLLGKYGGVYIPSGEGLGHYLFPVDGVIFDSPPQALTDADFANVFPAIRHMKPNELHLRGRHTIGDDSIHLLNQLRALRILDTSGTNLTLDGLKKLRIKGLKRLYVSPDTFKETDLHELQNALPNMNVSHYRSQP